MSGAPDGATPGSSAPAPPPRPARSRRRRWVLRGLGVSLLAVVAVDQGLRVAVADGWFRGTRVAPFAPPLFTESQVARVERLRDLADRGVRGVLVDPDLGWAPTPGTERGLYRTDDLGGRASARPFPPARRPGVRRVVAVGGSFTRGDEVPGEEAWLGRLHDGRDDLDVLNLGMGGYGLDQALVRLERDGLGVDAEEVWVGWCPSTSGRLLSVFPPVQRHASGTAHFKPRFEPDGAGGLWFVPPLATDEAGTVALLDDGPTLARLLIEHEYHAQRYPVAYRPAGASPWHLSGLARLGWTWAERRDRDVHAWLADPDHELRVVLRGLWDRTVRVAHAHGLRVRLVVLPGAADLARARSGARPWAAALEEALAAGLDVLDTTDALLASGLPDDRLWAPLGHHASEAAAVVADAVAAAWLDVPTSLSVATWNIHHGQRTDGPFDLPGQAAFAAALDADVLVLQEVDRATGRASGVDQVARLGELADRFASFGAAMPYDGGEYGEGALARRAPRDVRVHALPARPTSEPRAALELALLLDGEAVRVLGTHLDHLSEPDDRAAQALALVALLEADDRPTILAGDLNAALHDEELRPLARITRAALPRGTPTFPSDDPRQAIDHVLLYPRDAWEVLFAEVRPSGDLTDHCAVRAEVRRTR